MIISCFRLSCCMCSILLESGRVIPRNSCEYYNQTMRSNKYVATHKVSQYVDVKIIGSHHVDAYQLPQQTKLFVVVVLYYCCCCYQCLQLSLVLMQIAMCPLFRKWTNAAFQSTKECTMTMLVTSAMVCELCYGNS